MRMPDRAARLVAATPAALAWTFVAAFVLAPLVLMLWSTVASDGVWPARSALVLSDRSTSAPRRPKSASLCMSVTWPSTGVRSNLYSPVCTTRPSGVPMP